MASSVTLQSKSHAIQVEETDPLFADFFDSFRSNVDGPLPGVIPMSDEVLGQWPAWLRLQLWMAAGPQLFYADREAHPLKLSVLPSQQRKSWKTPAVALADIEYLQLSLLTLPPDWVLYVYVDERTSAKRRAEHYREVGSLIRSGRLVHSLTVWYDTALTSDLGVRRDPLHFLDASNEERGDEELHRSLEYAWGIVHGARLQQLGRGDELLHSYLAFRDRFGYRPIDTLWKGELYIDPLPLPASYYTSNVAKRGTMDLRGDYDWSLINWNDVHTLVHHEFRPSQGLVRSTTIRPEGDVNHLYVQYLAGIPQTEVYLSAKHMPLQPTRVTTYKDALMFDVDFYNLPLLYERLMSAYSLIDDPILLGLSPTLTYGSFLDINKVTGLSILPTDPATEKHNTRLEWWFATIHLYLLMFVARRSEDWTTKNYHYDIRLLTCYIPDTVRVMGAVIGGRGMAFITDKLLKYLEHTPDKKVEVWCDASLSWMEEHGTTSPFTSLGVLRDLDLKR